MLTRIEIDGFKTFEGFSLDLGPFLGVLGPNAAGKSNFFDALHLLSRLAWAEVGPAFSKIRGEPLELFRREAGGSPGKHMTLAAEVLVQPQVRDTFGTSAKLKHTRMRYEVGLERKKVGRGIERIFVVHEKARSISKEEDRWPVGGGPTSRAFRNTFLKYGTQPTTWLETIKEGGRRLLRVHDQEDRPAEEAEATFLSTVTTAREHPHLFALREELRSWRFLQLVPAALHQPSFISDPDQLEASGSNLAKVLARIETETATATRLRGQLADLVADLVALVPGVTGMEVKEEPDAKYRIEVRMKEGTPYSSRVVSDGTLRILALLAVLYDPRYRGLVCLEEPENGIHPGRLKAVTRRVRELVSDPQADEVDKQEPLGQMIVSSHSPVVLASLPPEEVVFFDTVSVVSPGVKHVRTKTRVRRLQSPREGAVPQTNGHSVVTRSEVNRYLSSALPED